MLISCKAGCEPEAVLGAAGLDWGGLFARLNGTGREIVATYDYPDPNGKLRVPDRALLAEGLSPALAGR